jgi:hypothetical protein
MGGCPVELAIPGDKTAQGSMSSNGVVARDVAGAVVGPGVNGGVAQVIGWVEALGAGALHPAMVSATAAKIFQSERLTAIRIIRVFGRDDRADRRAIIWFERL